MRKKGLFERIIMREPAKEDFSANKLPKNRVKLFSYMIKNKFFKIYKNHCLTVLFFAPLIVWGVLTMEYTDKVYSLEPQVGITHLVEYWFTVYVTAIPMWVLAFVGLSGGLNVIRKLAWSDPVVFKTDFFKRIKTSGKQMALIGFMWGTAYALIRYAIDWLGFYYQVFDDSYSVIFGILVCLFLLVVTFCYTVYMCCMSSMYNVDTKQLLVGAFKLYFADFFLATGVIVLSVSPILILLLLGFAYTTLLAYFSVFSLLLGIVIIPMFLVCQHSFDRIINKKDYPNYYGRGLSYGVNPSCEAVITDNNASDVTEMKDTNEEEIDFERVDDGEN